MKHILIFLLIFLLGIVYTTEVYGASYNHDEGKLIDNIDAVNCSEDFFAEEQIYVFISECGIDTTICLDIDTTLYDIELYYTSGLGGTIITEFDACNNGQSVLIPLYQTFGSITVTNKITSCEDFLAIRRFCDSDFCKSHNMGTLVEGNTITSTVQNLDVIDVVFDSVVWSIPELNFNLTEYNVPEPATLDYTFAVNGVYDLYVTFSVNGFDAVDQDQNRFMVGDCSNLPIAETITVVPGLSVDYCFGVTFGGDNFFVEDSSAYGQMSKLKGIDNIGCFRYGSAIDAPLTDEFCVSRGNNEFSGPNAIFDGHPLKEFRRISVINDITWNITFVDTLYHTFEIEQYTDLVYDFIPQESYTGAVEIVQYPNIGTVWHNEDESYLGYNPYHHIIQEEFAFVYCPYYNEAPFQEAICYYEHITVNVVPCISETDITTLYTSACNDGANYCYGIDTSDLSDYNIYLNDELYVGNTEFCEEGTSFQLPLGENVLVFEELGGNNCIDSSFVTVICDCAIAEVIFEETLITEDCDYGIDYCYPINNTELSNYNIFLNGFPFSNIIGACGDSTSFQIPIGLDTLVFENTITLCTDTAYIDVICNSPCDLTDCVFPGDTDHNMIANNFDLLPIGLAYNTQGPTRYDATTNWEGQYCEDWLIETTPLVNDKHIDTNGDGMIDSLDMDAINLNYNAEHDGINPLRQMDAPKVSLVYDSDSYEVILNDNLEESVVITADIVIENEDGGEVENLYGIAFTISYPEIPVFTNSAGLDSIEILYDNDSWLGTSDEMLELTYNTPYTQSVDIAYSRKDQEPRTGLGKIASIKFVIDDNLIGKGNDWLELIVNAEVNQIKAVDHLGNEIAMNGSVNSTSIFYNFSTSNDEILLDNLVEVYPNPVDDELYINIGNLDGREAIVYNTLGQAVLTKELSNQESKIQTTHLSPGIYIININTMQGIISKKMIIE